MEARACCRAEPQLCWACAATSHGGSSNTAQECSVGFVWEPAPLPWTVSPLDCQCRQKQAWGHGMMQLQFSIS